MQQLNQIGFEAGVTSVYSPVMMYTPHMLDAAIQTVNALHQNHPIDFGISLGDTCNSNQYNELRWYIDVIDGKVIKPSSGAHAGTGGIDYQKPFKAAGLDPSIPWYQAIGNHDHFWIGSIPPDGKYGDDPFLRESCISDQVIAMTNTLYLANDIYSYKNPGATLYYQDQLMIIAAHIPIGVQKAGTFMEWFDNSANPDAPQNAVDLSELLEELHGHPNLLMWIAGHRHVNAVKAFESPDPVYAPENGFWQVETSSLHDFPQQLRMFDIKLNSDYTISIVTTNVDPIAKEGTPAWTSRKYAVAAQQIVNTELISSG